MTQLTPHPILVWSDALALDLPLMDATHHEFVDLLATVVQAPEDKLLNAWRALIAHTQDHFDREDQWMQATGFSSSNCHTTQHQMILQVMREGEKLGVTGEYAVVRQMADELGVWFPQHAQSMDGPLAMHLRSVGYDAATGQIHQPQALPKQTLHGCGGATCSGTDEQAEVETIYSPL